MSRTTPAQVSFNGGEISQRLRARIDQSLYGISAAEMVGFAPLTEGPMEAMPGFLHVAQALGPCRLFRFEAYATQGHVVEASALKFRVYTNNALIESSPGTPLEVVSPFSYAKVQGLNTHVSYDVMYCFDGDGAMEPREFRRDGATTFSFATMSFDDGPFEPMNSDDSVTLTADDFTGTITLTASAATFASTDVGRLVRFETKDFGTIKAWEPGITVTAGDIRASEERAYTAATTGRTGGLQPTHTEGDEWDGMAAGTDVNNNAAPGVQWTYTHDRYGFARITGYTDSTHVAAEVLRRLPFTGATGTTWRWSLGAWSTTTGNPQCGTIWNERFCAARGNRIDAGVVGDIAPPSFETLNEFGEISADMAFSVTLDDPNPILALVADDKLIAITATGVYALVPRNAAAALGPGNVKAEKQNDHGGAAAMAVPLDSRTLYIGKGGRRILELDLDPARAVEGSLDLTRYARHIGTSALTALAVQLEPLPFVWATRADGSLACASYNPDEQVLGFCRRPLASGLLGRSIATCTDPAGIYDQLWLAAEFGGNWHVLRMGEWREDGDSDTEAVMADMAYLFDDTATTTFAVPLLAGLTVDVAADGRFYLERTVPASGNLVLDAAHERAMIGLRFDAWAEGLPIESGGDAGPAIGKKGQVSRGWVKLLQSRGLRFGVPEGVSDGDTVAAEMKDVTDGQSVEAFEWEPYSGFHHEDALGDHVDEPKLRVERIAPAQATVLAWGCRVEVQQK